VMHDVQLPMVMTVGDAKAEICSIRDPRRET
jgi:hypothetical protein